MTAADGPTAIALLAQEKAIDLLFTDIVLPGGMNGRQLADEALKRRPQLKVLFTTGYTRNAVVHNGRLDPGVESDRKAVHIRRARFKRQEAPRLRLERVQLSRSKRRLIA